MAETSRMQLVFAADIARDGTYREITERWPETKPVESGWRWIHADLGAPGVAEWVEARLPAIAAGALLQSETRPRADGHGAGVILNLRGVNLNPGGVAEDMVSLRMWATADIVVSVRIRRVFAVTDLIDTARVSACLPVNPGAFLVEIVERLTNRIEATSVELEDMVAELEEARYADMPGAVGNIPPLRRRAIRLRRHIAPQRDALLRLAEIRNFEMDALTRAALSEEANRTARAVEEVEAARDRLAALQDHEDALESRRIARNGYVLSVVAAIFLPLGFLTGVFGMNVAGLPGTEAPRAFWTLAGAMAALAIVIVLILRRLRLF